MRWKKEKAIPLILLITASMLLAFLTILTVKAEGTAKIWTDKPDYAPGETVIIYGEGFQGRVTITVVRPDGTVNDPENGIVGEWTVNADENGMFETTYKLDGILGEYNVTATDEYGNTATTTFTDAVQISAVKSSGPSYPPEKDSFLTTENVYAVVISNSGSGDKTFSIYVVSSLPSPPGWLTDVSGGIETFTIGQQGTHGPYLIWEAPTTAGNYYIVIDVNTNQKLDSDDVCDSFSISMPTADLSITKSGPNYAYVGDEITFTFSVSNSGPDSAAYVTVTDDKAGTTTYVNGDTNGNGMLDVVETWIFTATYKVLETDPDPLTNTATVTSTTSDPNTNNNQASWTVDVLHPAIDVIKSANASMIHEGDWVKYNVTVVNTGDCDLTVTLKDTLLGISWTGTLKPNEKYEVIKSIQPKDDPTENTASATGVDALGGTDSDSDSWTVDILHPAIDVEKSGPVYAHEGDTITYTITVENTGDCPLSDVSVTDSLLGTIYSDGLDFKEKKTFTIDYTVGSYGLLRNTVTASGEDALGLYVFDSASWPVTVLPKSMVTTSRLCYFDFDSTMEGQQFRLIFTQDPTSPSTYKLTASNPGQFYYNIFYIGTSGDSVGLTIKIPYPFVTQGAVPIHVYSAVDIVGGCFIPSGDITGSFTIDPKSIALEDYMNGYVEITVSGEVPESGLVYVTIHLDYGLKKTVGYTPDSDKNAEKPIGTDVIVNGAPYTFEVSGGLTDSQTIKSVNAFKRDPGFAGIVTDSQGNPLAGVEVKIYGPDGKLLAKVETDGDGWYFFNYKHTGKVATYTIVCNGITKTVTVKANQLVQVDFTV